MKRTLIILFSLVACSVHAQALERSVVASGGDFHANSTGQLSLTLGEPVIETVAGGGSELTQGFQQTNIEVVGIADAHPEFKIQVFPNPTSAYVTLTLDQLPDNLNYDLHSLTGTTLLQKKLTSLSTQLDLGAFSNGAYFLTILDGTLPLQTFKLIKQ